MNITDSLRFHKNVYDYMYRFDDNTSIIFNFCLYAVCFLCYYLGLSAILKFLLKKKIINSTHKNAPIISFVFSNNHKIVNEQLIKSGIDFPIYDLSFDKKKSKGKVIRFSSMILLLSTLANAKKYLSVLQEIREDNILSKNKFKFFKLSGYEFLYKNLLRNVNTVVKFNDHIFNSMLLFDICKSKNIKTVYIQHAPVSPRFPELHHDLNVLFSKDSLEKYINNDKTKEVFQFVDIRMLVGGEPSQVNDLIKDRILIAANILDDFEKIKEIVKSLVTDFRIIIRPHPRDKRNFDSLIINDRVVLSKGNTIWQDMDKCGIVLCNESGVPLEAIYYQRKFYKVPFLSESRDGYQFVKKGLITKEFFKLQNLIDAIKNNEECVNQSKLEHFIGDINKYEELTIALKNKIMKLA